MPFKGHLAKAGSYEILGKLSTAWRLALHLSHSFPKQQLDSMLMRVQERRKPGGGGGSPLSEAGCLCWNTLLPLLYGDENRCLCLNTMARALTHLSLKDGS